MEQGFSTAEIQKTHPHTCGKEHGQPAHGGKLRLVVILAQLDPTVL
jgi:hypothetical protein